MSEQPAEVLEIPHEDQLVFVDCETFGLDPWNQPAWEWCVIKDGIEHVWQVWHPVSTLQQANSFALEVGKFHERGHVEWDENNPDLLSPSGSIAKLVKLITGRHIVGLVPSFDEERLRTEFVRVQASAGVDAYDSRMPWAYHILDMEAMMIGWLAAKGYEFPVPWKSDQLSELVRVPYPDEDERHTAAGDARWARRIYAHLMQHPPRLFDVT